MQHRDYLKAQIEQMGRVLGKALAELLGLKAQGNVNQGVAVANEQLKSELDLDLNNLLLLGKTALKKYAEEKLKSADNIEVLSIYLKEIGEIKTPTDKILAKAYLNQSLELLEIANAVSKAFSLERMNIKSEIERLLIEVS